MRKVIFRCILSLVLMLVIDTSAQSASKIQEVTTPSGLKAWLIEDHTIPVVSLRCSFNKAGYAHVPAEKAGLVDMVSHMLDEGAGPLTGREFTEKMQKLAIILGFDCNVDEFNVSLKTTTAHRQEAFDMLKFALTQPRFDEKEFNKIKAASLTALKTKEKTPNFIAAKTFSKTFMANHPYERIKSGTQDTLNALKPEDLKTFVKNAFAQDTLTIGVCGDITPQELVVALENIFKDLPQKSSSPDIAPLTYLQKGETKVVQANFPQSQVIFAQKGLKSRDPNFVYMVVLNQILGASPSSRLFSEVRIKRGNAYSISSFVENYNQASLFGGGMGGDNANVLESVRLIKDIWQNMKDQGVTSSELEHAKSHVQGAFVLNLSSSSKIAELLHSYQRWGYPIDYPEKRDKLIQGVTLDKMNTFIKGFLDPTALTFVVVGNPKT